MPEPIYEKFNHSNQVVWEFEYNGKPFQAIKKKNKHGILLDKTYLFTNGGGGGYYETTAFAVFSQKFWLENMIGIKLRIKGDLSDG